MSTKIARQDAAPFKLIEETTPTVNPEPSQTNK